MNPNATTFPIGPSWNQNQTMFNGPMANNNNGTYSPWNDPSKHPHGMGYVQKRLYCEVMTMDAGFFDASSAAVDISGKSK